MDFLSIKIEEKFAKCRYCNHLVGSENPICQNCGLEMSSEGIFELAELEAWSMSALDEINKQSEAARMLILCYSVIGCFFFFVSGSVFGFYIPYGFSVMLSFLGMNKLYQLHSQKFLKIEESDRLKTSRKKSIVTFLVASTAGLALFFLLKTVKNMF